MQDLEKFSVPKGFRGRSAFMVQLWWLVSATLFARSPQFMYPWRRFLLRLFGAKIGKKVIVRPSAKITYPWKVSIGDFSWIGDDVVLYSLGDVSIANNVVVSQRSYLCTGSHDYEAENFAIFSKPIVVEKDAWVASDVFVHPGVVIGEGAVVAARSTVTCDLPPKMVCAGYPAKPVKSRKKNCI